MKKILAAVGMVGALLAAPAANAALVTTWDFTVTLDWTAASFSSGNGSTSWDNSVISWGKAGADYTNPDLSASNSRSALVISNSPANGAIDTNGAAEQTNTITHYNNAILNSFSKLTTAELVTTLTLTPAVPAAGPAIGPFGTSFGIKFIETSNSSPCGFTSTTVCDDIFVITFGDLDFSFDYDGVTYDVSIFEVTNMLGALSDAACAKAGAAAGCIGFQTPEDAFTPATFAFTITAVNEVPEPGLLALLGIGLVGLGVARRKAA